MKKLRNSQLFLQASYAKSTTGAELQKIDQLLQESPDWLPFLRRIQEKLSTATGASARITTEQVVKAGLIKSLYNCSFRKLAELTTDSRAVGTFLGLRFDQALSKSVLHKAISSIDAEDWRFLNRILIKRGVELDIEYGDIIRSDTTVTETNIHHPTDSSLLVDGIRILTRLLSRLQEIEGALIFSNHNRRAKARLYEINNSKSNEQRYPHYQDLLKVGKMTLGYVQEYLLSPQRVVKSHLRAKYLQLRQKLVRNQELMQAVLQQTFDRVVAGKSVPVEDKVISFVEPDTDIIKKGGRETQFGHKISLTTGRYLISSCEVLDGNPSDRTLVTQVLEEHLRLYKVPPAEVAFDGGYSSLTNRDYLKELGVREITFCKHGSLPRESLRSTKKKYRELMNFRAGIEGVISCLKRDYGLKRIFEHGRRKFESVVQRSIVAFNLRTIVRLL